ncbi:hypothetical protein RISK_000343 [Rhodopirellula islandica]|uniref:Uncharacterized protein n=1 Tax=Rhodopirellula islandica TaxID=595434 RepID=A0A0J1BMC3_RHOIS|nr:hypothetical protein RISK_000343 [Rhodopirellula islandica]
MIFVLSYAPTGQLYDSPRHRLGFIFYVSVKQRLSGGLRNLW